MKRIAVQSDGGSSTDTSKSPDWVNQCIYEIRKTENNSGDCIYHVWFKRRKNPYATWYHVAPRDTFDKAMELVTYLEEADYKTWLNETAKTEVVYSSASL